MIEMIWQYVGFLLKVMTGLAAFGLVLAMIGKSRGQEKSKMRMRYLNAAYDGLKLDLLTSLGESGSAYVKLCTKEEKEAQKSRLKRQKVQKEHQKTTFVLSFKGGMACEEVEALREEITALLLVAMPEDEVVLRLESPGGAVNGYGLLAAQLERIKEAGLILVVCVDKVAASGGYLAACIADRIIAAPYALVGSIGVVSTVPNFYEFLKEHQIDVLEITAGKHKRPLGMLTKPTEEGVKHVEKQLNAIHKQFKDTVQKYRPEVDTKRACTGDFWTAQEAMKLKLVDELMTSDGYVNDCVRRGDVYVLETPKQQSFLQKLQSKSMHLLYNLGLGGTDFGRF